MENLGLKRYSIMLNKIKFYIRLFGPKKLIIINDYCLMFNVDLRKNEFTTSNVGFHRHVIYSSRRFINQI